MIFFRKLHGLGNDFIVLDATSDRSVLEQATPPFARRCCQRHRGIGADGLLLICPAEQGGDARMRVINADGSEPQNCGNGLRCVVKALYDHHPHFAGRQRIVIETLGGLTTCLVTQSKHGKAERVRVSMPPPCFERRALPMSGSGSFIDQPVEIDGQRRLATAVSVGNPHLVFFVDSAAMARDYASKHGPTLEQDRRFAERTNVEFAHIDPSGITLWVWERGAGLTQACGTGACATVAAAVKTQRLVGDTATSVRLPGGELSIEVANDQSQLWMEGPAEEVFSGQIPP